MSKLLVVTNDFPTRRGGIESFVLALCKRMDPSKVVVYTASMPDDTSTTPLCLSPSTEILQSILLPTPAVGRRAVQVMRLARLRPGHVRGKRAIGIALTEVSSGGSEENRRSHPRA